MTAPDEKPFEPGIGFFASLIIAEIVLLFVEVAVFFGHRMHRLNGRFFP